MCVDEEVRVTGSTRRRGVRYIESASLSFAPFVLRPRLAKGKGATARKEWVKPRTGRERSAIRRGGGKREREERMIERRRENAREGEKTRGAKIRMSVGMPGGGVYRVIQREREREREIGIERKRKRKGEKRYARIVYFVLGRGP